MAPSSKFIVVIQFNRSCSQKKSHPLGDLNPVYTIQPVLQPVWQPAVSCKQTSNRLSNGFHNRFDKHGWTTSRMFVYTIQPVVKPVVKQVWQPCWTNNCSFNRLSIRVVQPVWQRVWQQVILCKPGFRGNVWTSSVARWKARVRLPIQHNWTFC